MHLLPGFLIARRREVAALGFCAALGFGATTPAMAGDWTPESPASSPGLIYELKLGALYHDTPGLWSGFSLEKPAVDTNLEIDFHPFYSNGASTILPVVGGTLNPDGQTSHAYADVHWRIQPGTAWYVNFGIGAAYNNGVIGPTEVDRKALGSHLLFHPTAELGLMLDAHNDISIYFEHMSNANTQRYNEGMDDIGLRYGYRF